MHPDHNHAAHSGDGNGRAGHGHAGHDHSADDPALAEILDLDAQVLRSYWDDALTTVRRAVTCATGTPTHGPATRRILDLGAGTGTATIALAQHFQGSEIIAVDSSADMLSRIRTKALDLGLAPRIRTVQADLDLPWPAFGTVDLTWASMSLHHLTNPDRVLRDVFAATRPGGLVAVAEIVEPLRFLPADVGIGSPGLEDRCLALLTQQQALSLPELGSAWSPRLLAAGFDLVSDRTLAIELDPPHEPAAPRYAQLWLQRMRSGLADQLAPDDRATLDALVDGSGPEAIRNRTDLQIRGGRTLTVAQRP